MIFLVREGARVQPTEEVRQDGSIKRYITVPVTRLRRMPIVEFIIGPRNDLDTARDRAIQLLTRAGYPDPAAKVVLSTVTAD